MPHYLVLHDAAVSLAQELVAASDGTARWVGRDALRDLTRPMVMRKLHARKVAKPVRRGVPRGA